MPAKLTQYQIPDPYNSVLLKNAPDVVPSVEELERIHSELKLLKQKTMERAKKAGDDIRAIDESMRRLREKEKGKVKAVDRIKRESFTPLPDGDDTRLSGTPASKPRNLSQPLGTGPPSRASLDPRRTAIQDSKLKKKKRKRDDDSDGEADAPPHKSTPPSNLTPSIPPPAKSQKPVLSVPQSHSKPVPGPDFSVPASQDLLFPRPPIPPPPIPGPSKPSEVTEDFSKAKQPSQTLVTTFYSSIEPWIRPIREEDVGFLEYTGDEVEPFIMPKLGRHYTEAWEDQDAGLLPPVILTNEEALPTHFAPPEPKWDPSTLGDLDLATEEKGHGPLTERVISALLPLPDPSGWKGVKAAEDAMEGRPGGSGAAAARKERLNVTDLEARIRDNLRFHGLLDSPPDFTEKVDDPIATALRQAQSELRHVIATNKARKARLIDIARDRLGYQEYLDLRDSIDKNITTLYTKLQKKDVPKLNKKKKKPNDRDSVVDGGNGNAGGGNGNGSGVGANAVAGIGVVPLPCPAAMGFGQDDEHRLVVNDQLRHLVETRRQWVDTIGAVFEQKQRDNPGRIWGLPKESIYKGMEEEVDTILRNPPPVPVIDELDLRTRGSKGKEKAVLRDEMDVG